MPLPPMGRVVGIDEPSKRQPVRTTKTALRDLQRPCQEKPGIPAFGRCSQQRAREDPHGRPLRPGWAGVTHRARPCPLGLHWVPTAAGRTARRPPCELKTWIHAFATKEIKTSLPICVLWCVDSPCASERKKLPTAPMNDGSASNPINIDDESGGQGRRRSHAVEQVRSS